MLFLESSVSKSIGKLKVWLRKDYFFYSKSFSRSVYSDSEEMLKRWTSHSMAVNKDAAAAAAAAILHLS